MVSINMDDIGPDEKSIIAAVPQDGSPIGNKALRAKLRWAEKRYFAARNVLLDAGLLLRGRGHGGSVRLATTDATYDDGTPIYLAKPVLDGELELYRPMCDVIATEWAAERGIEQPLAVEITALQGRKSTGGLWSRPDIVSVDVRTFRYVPGKFLELVTFEVKMGRALNVRAVYEALAHRRSATHSYVLAHIPHRDADLLQTTVDDVATVARQHSIGLITARRPDDFDTWYEVVEAQRVDPDPERLDSFIKAQLSLEAQDRLLARLK